MAEMFDKFYFNFFSVGSLIPFSFCMMIGIFFLTIENRSKASLSMGGAFLAGTGTLAAAYFISSSYYTPLAAYHRYFTVGGTLLGLVFISQFFFYFPEPKYVSVAKWYRIVQIILSVVVMTFFVYSTQKSKIVYNFAGIYYDFDAELANKYSGLFILTGTFMMIGLGIWRTIITKTWERWAVLVIMISLFIIVGMSATANSLSREGAIDRATYHYIWDLGAMFGGFVLVTTYINVTKDKTSFMVKIIGISMVTLLLAFLIISYYTLQDREDFYDRIHSDISTKIYKEGLRSYPELEYNLVYQVKKDSLDRKIGKVNLGKSDEIIKFELLNTMAFQKIKALRQESFASELEETLSGVHDYFGGYRNYVLRISKEIPANKNPSVFMGESLIRMIPYLNYRNLKIQKLSDDKFRTEIQKFLESQKGDFEPFKQEMISHLKSSSSEGTVLKTEILNFILPMKEQGTRGYRGDPYSEKHYVSFVVYDPGKEILSEYGFSIKAYRTFIHQTGKKIVIILVVFVALIAFGFRFFFSGALINPLESLLAGVKKVNEGDLSVRVPVKVEDEIGFLSHSFNSMVSSIREGKEKLEEYAQTLEQKVEERTAELKESLVQVNALKDQQDGDYFLTSLLLKPLGANLVQSENVRVEFFIKQKKKFTFRNWNEEIGGDICIARNLTLKNKNHVVFMNADAMGKSMQGAGGALVLGAVFESIVERTLISPNAQDQFPERWMKNAFIELHKVFESFNGSMLVSLVVGLLDENTGLLYYINAEHPYSILYRDGKASFVEEDMDFRKLGTEGVAAEIFVRTFAMMPGDVLIAGSDGRDDLLLRYEQGDRIINEDTDLILKTIEKSEGKLEGIYSECKKIGEITDDFSLLRISFQEHIADQESAPVEENTVNALRMLKSIRENKESVSVLEDLQKAYALSTSHPSILKALIKAYLEVKDFARAAKLVEDYLYLQPADSEMIYIGSNAYKKLGDYAKAADFGERLRLRDPKRLKNLVNLGEIYFRMKHYVRARQMIESAFAIDPENNKAIAVKEALDKIPS